MSAEEGQDKTPTLRYTYLKSNHFRVIKADGAWGGITPRGDILMSLYNERPPIPNEQDFEVADGGKLKLAHQTAREGVVREVEAAISLSPEVALAIANWLNNMVKQFSKQTGMLIEIDPATNAVKVTDLKQESKDEKDENES